MWVADLQNYSVSDIAHLIHQDVLLLAGEQDYMIPLKEYHNNMSGITNARSLTGRVFTSEDTRTTIARSATSNWRWM